MPLPEEPEESASTIIRIRSNITSTAPTEDLANDIGALYLRQSIYDVLMDDGVLSRNQEINERTLSRITDITNTGLNNLINRGIIRGYQNNVDVVEGENGEVHINMSYTPIYPINVVRATISISDTGVKHHIETEVVIAIGKTVDEIVEDILEDK